MWEDLLLLIKSHSIVRYWSQLNLYRFTQFYKVELNLPDLEVTMAPLYTQIIAKEVRCWAVELKFTVHYSLFGQNSEL